jgi:AAA domain
MTAAKPKLPAADPLFEQSALDFEKRGATLICRVPGWGVMLIARDTYFGTGRLLATFTLARTFENGRKPIRIYTSHLDLLTGSQRAGYAKECARRMRGTTDNPEETDNTAVLAMLDGTLEHLLESRNDIIFKSAREIECPDDLTPPYALWPLVPRSRPGMLVAPSGSGKSQAALLCGLIVVTGVALLPRLEPRVHGRVVYIGQEEDEEQWKARLRMVCRGHDLDPDKIEDDYYYMKLPGSSLIESAEIIAERAAQIKAAMLIVDSAQATWGSGEEQVREYAARWFNAIDLIAVPTLIVEHPNASNTNSAKGNGGVVAGSSVKRDRVGHQWSLKSTELPRRDDSEPYRYHTTLVDVKRNYVARQPAIVYETAISGYSWMKFAEADALTADSIVEVSRLWGAISSIMRPQDDEHAEYGWSIEDLQKRLGAKDDRRIRAELNTDHWRAHPLSADLQERPVKIKNTGFGKGNPGRYRLETQHLILQFGMDDLEVPE